MSRLYDLTEQYNNILSVIDIMEDEENKDLFTKALQEIQDNIEDKAEGIAKLIANIKGDVAKIKEEQDRLAKRKKVLENKVDSLMEYLTAEMQKIEKEEIKTPLFTIKFAKTPAKVEILDEALLDNKYFITKKEVSKIAIKEDLKQGIEVKGATLTEGGKTLRIK